MKCTGTQEEEKAEYEQENMRKKFIHTNSRNKLQIYRHGTDAESSQEDEIQNTTMSKKSSPFSKNMASNRTSYYIKKNNENKNKKNRNNLIIKQSEKQKKSNRKYEKISS